MDCVFCRIPGQQILLENDHFFAIRDIHPVSRGHCLIVAKRHCQDWFALSEGEMLALREISQSLKAWLDREFQPDGVNLGVNCGAAAGQSVFHFHMHVIPRYSGDRRRRFGMREFVKEIL